MAPRLRLEQTRPTGANRARGLVSSRSSGRRVDAWTYAPPPAHAEVVASLWVGCWDLRGQEPHETELLSDPSANLAFERGDSPHAGSRLVGVWTRLWRRRLEGVGNVRGVKLRPGAFRAFVDAPAHHFANRMTPLEALFDDLDRVSQALAASDHEETFGAIAAWLDRHRRDDPDVGLAVAIAQRIADEPAITSVERLAQIAGLGPRSLQRLFRDHVGAPPKWVIRRHRLQEVAARLERGDGPTLAALAAELGYADQAHLARDFKQAVGRSPSETASRMR